MTKPTKFETASGILRLCEMETVALEGMAKASKPYFRMQATCEKLARKGLAEYVGNRLGSKIRHYQLTERGREVWLNVVKPTREPRYFGP